MKKNHLGGGQGGPGRRRFMRACGGGLLGSLILGLLGRPPLARDEDDYVIVNGWVLPAAHLGERSDAQEL